MCFLVFMSGVGFYFSTFILLRLLFLCFYGRKLDDWNEKKIGRLGTLFLLPFVLGLVITSFLLFRCEPIHCSHSYKFFNEWCPQCGHFPTITYVPFTLSAVAMFMFPMSLKNPHAPLLFSSRLACHSYSCRHRSHTCLPDLIIVCSSLNNSPHLLRP